MTANKICSGCKGLLPLATFHKSKATKDGHSSLCKDCACTATKAWALENPERVRTNAQSAYRKNKAKIIAAARKWALENPKRRKEIALASARRIAALKPPGTPGRPKLPMEAKRENWRHWQAIRRDRIRKNGGEIHLDFWRAIFELFETKVCLYCGKYDQALVMDHFIPLARGGRTEAGNLLPCCAPCNHSKGAKMPDQWVLERVGDIGYAGILLVLAATRDAYRDTYYAAA